MTVPAGKAAAIVPAYDEAARIAATVRALRAVPAVGEIIVVDDGSSDGTADIARTEGATVLRQRNAGKGAALRAGVLATTADVVAFIDADLGDTAAVAGPLAEPVLLGEADMTIAAPPPSGPSGFGLVEGFARWGIARASGFEGSRPLSGQRALRREIVERFGIAGRFGVEVALTIDAVRAGYRVREVPFPIEHDRTGRNLAGFVHRAKQGLDVAAVLATRFRLRTSRSW